MLGFFKRKKDIKVIPPFKGEVVEITKVPDMVFSDKMLGDGFAVTPVEELTEVVAPIDGKIVQIFPTFHAIGLESEEGIEILIHIGIDTVELQGEGFTPVVAVGDKVKQGQPLMKVDFKRIEELGKPTITPVVFTSPLSSMEIITGKGPAAGAMVRL